jgi:type III pantothenate kinase
MCRWEISPTGRNPGREWLLGCPLQGADAHESPGTSVHGEAAPGGPPGQKAGGQRLRDEDCRSSSSWPMDTKRGTGLFRVIWAGMILVIDVGNTNTVLGLMDGDRVAQTFRISSAQRATDELGVLIVQLLQHQGYQSDQVDGAICSSVVPSLVYSVEKACRKYLEVDLMVVGRDKLRTGMKIRVDNPREVGADRIVNGVAAINRWGGPIIVVDFGTATTFDCVSEDGAYVGGAIAPGFKISEEALFSRTAKLPRVELAKPPQTIGTNTRHAMQSGLFWGYVGLVDFLAEKCRQELDPKSRVVATGGFAPTFQEESTTIEEVDSYLTLRGLALIYGMNS